MILIEKLTKRYGEATIFEQVDLTLHPGTISGLVGENGCGKTTLMRCICGFTKPTEGRVTVLDQVIGKDVDFAPSTGVIIENSGFLNHYSARQNLALLADISGKADKRRIDEVIRLVGLDPDSKKHVGKYSLGMTQRLAIAQAIMEDPDILILDEPFNGLDKQGQADIHDLLQSLKAQGKTILLASHSAGDISRACDMIFEFLHGKITKVVQ
ncbi:MAG: ATP-binding cassette domain-containing protein [Clostridiales bacterium]|jgi:ABC-2 type transport system ATP-binding protein|nr:ATP-binding cassette domain-containing protein [Clostridiales bacterium]